MEKRSLTLSGHRTSIALEPEFWAALETMAATRGLPLSGLIREIDSRREGDNLSSAVRVAILRWYQAASESSGESDDRPGPFAGQLR